MSTDSPGLLHYFLRFPRDSFIFLIKISTLWRNKLEILPHSWMKTTSGYSTTRFSPLLLRGKNPVPQSPLLHWSLSLTHFWNFRIFHFCVFFSPRRCDLFAADDVHSSDLIVMDCKNSSPSIQSCSSSARLKHQYQWNFIGFLVLGVLNNMSYCVSQGALLCQKEMLHMGVHKIFNLACRFFSSKNFSLKNWLKNCTKYKDNSSHVAWLQRYWPSF